MWNITNSALFPKPEPEWDGKFTIKWGGDPAEYSFEYSGDASLLHLGEIVIPSPEA